MNQPKPVQTINYAQRTPLSGGRLWAAAVLAMAALGLITLGGCFLIGVLLLFNPSLAFAPIWTWGACLFCGVLSLLAASCFCFGAWLLWSTTRSLLHSLTAIEVESVDESK